MQVHNLVMRFYTETPGKLFSLTIDDVKSKEDGTPKATEQEVIAFMDLVIAKNVFQSENGKLVSKKDAKIVTTSHTEYDVA